MVVTNEAREPLAETMIKEYRQMKIVRREGLNLDGRLVAVLQVR